MKLKTIKLSNFKLHQRGKWLVCLFLFEIIVCVFFVAYLSERIPDYSTHVGNNDERQVIHDLTSEYIVEQSFISPRDFDFITLDFSDHDIMIAGKTQLFVYDENKMQICYREINNSDINYGESVIISFLDLGGGKANQLYEAKITERGTEQVALGLYGYEIGEDDEPAYVNSQPQSYAVSIGTHSYTKAFRVLAVLIMFICTSGSLGTVLLCTKNAVPEEKCFLMIAIPFGLCMLLFLSGNSVYDAQAHLAKTYQYSNILLGVGDGDSDNYTYMRSADVKVGVEKSGVINEQAQEYWRTLNDWTWLNWQYGMEKSSYHGASPGGTILGYLPNVIGMTLGRIINLGAYPIFYLSKIMGFAIYLIICFWAIKKTPILKTTFSFTAALPMCLYNATGITYDTMTVAATLLMCAYIFIWWVRKLKIPEWIILGISIVFVGGCKGGIFLPIIILLFLVPFSRFRINIKKLVMIIVLFVGGVGVFLYKYKYVLVDYLQVTIVSDNPDARYGSGYCFIYPLSFLKMLIQSIVIRGDAYIGQMIGDRTAWTKAHIEWIIIIPFIILLILSGIRKVNEENIIDNRKRFIVLVLLIAEFVGLHVILMSDTKIGSSYIYGVQGRYFVALVPLMILVIQDRNIHRGNESVTKLYIIFSMLQSVYMLSLLDKFF